MKRTIAIISISAILSFPIGFTLGTVYQSSIEQKNQISMAVVTATYNINNYLNILKTLSPEQENYAAIESINSTLEGYQHGIYISKNAYFNNSVDERFKLDFFKALTRLKNYRIALNIHSESDEIYNLINK